MKMLSSEVKIIKEKGRAENESAVVLIADGIYKGFGFIDTDIQISSIDDIEAFITPQKHTLETESILTQYFLKHSKSQVLAS